MGDGNTEMMNSGIYVLKHKDLDVAMVQINMFSGEIEYVLEVYLPEELPIGCLENGRGLSQWWELRAIPDTRKGLRNTLTQLGETTNLSLMLSAYGFSLVDHYWMQPIGEEMYWKDLNFYENSFSEQLGGLLTETNELETDSDISKYSPSSSVNGEMKKEWLIIDGQRYLLKVNTNDYGQQSINELIASKLHEILDWKNYVPYKVKMMDIGDSKYPCSFSPLFTSAELEFVSAHQLLSNYKIPNTVSSYEAVIRRAVEFGMDEGEVRNQLEYTILTDFLLTNTDRHFNNFGFLYHPIKHKLAAMAPIFDTGNALFYDKEVIPSGDNLLDIKVTSFREKEVNLLQYVSGRNRIDLNKLSDFPKQIERLLKEYTSMPEGRAGAIAQTVLQKLEYLKIFQQGISIWKKKNYW